jgi:hypothetical protein
VSEAAKPDPAAISANLLDWLEASDYPGEAAERIAAELRISFSEALALVRQWEAAQ